MKIQKPREAARDWYLPHFGITNPNKPGKMRLVFDGSAFDHGFSLSYQLLKGPTMLCSLPRVLMRFRQKPVAFMGDSQEMFPQIIIWKKD